jgi:hypothetical protein
MSHDSEHVDNLLDGVVGAVVGGFDLAMWTVVGVRAVVEAAVGDRSAEPLWKTKNSRATWTPCAMLGAFFL